MKRILCIKVGTRKAILWLEASETSSSGAPIKLAYLASQCRCRSSPAPTEQNSSFWTATSQLSKSQPKSDAMFQASNRREDLLHDTLIPNPVPIPIPVFGFLP